MRDDQVVLTGELLVPDGATVGTAVIFNGDATIEGTATESVVVFNGDVEISGTVGDDVVAFNGHVIVRSGAEVDGDIASRQPARIEDGATVRGQVKGITRRFDLEGLGWVGRYVWWFGYTISTLVLGLVLLLFAPGLDPSLTDVFRRRMGGSFGFGAAIFFLLPIAAVLLLVVVVTIPLGLFLLLALALLYTLGYVAGAHVLGRQLVKPPSSRFLAFLIGWMILRGIGLIPVLGGLVWVVASIAGLGAIVLAARGSRPAARPARAGGPDPRAAAPRRLGGRLGGRIVRSRLGEPLREHPHDADPDVGSVVDHALELAAADADRAHVPVGHERGDPRPARDQGHLADDFAGAPPRDLGAAGLHADRAARDDQQLVAQLALGREELTVRERTLLCDLRDRAQVGGRELVEQGDAP